MSAHVRPAPAADRRLVGALALPFLAACGPGAPPERPGSAAPAAPEIAAVVDDAGWFEITDAAVTDVWAASRGLRGVAGRWGRLDASRDEAPAVSLRGADGAFERVGLSLRPVPQSLEERAFTALRERAASFGADGTSRAFARLVAGEDGGRSPTFVVLTFRGGGPHAAPPPSAAGADLAAWAPADRPFVRFRSVEAAYRFTDAADRLAARLLAAHGDGRDHGTLRWALHDLLLPTIWRTNPEGERGAGEVAVVLESPYGRGRPEVAALFRITDPEIHRMHVEAGISQEAQEDHLWRPADDPFPLERARRNFRATRADVEWVATSEAAMRAHRENVPRLADHPDWRRARGGAAPARDEAFFFWAPSVLREGWRGAGHDADVRARREEAGLAALATRWTGLSRAWGERVVPAEPVPVERLLDVVSVRAVTDTSGAAVEVVLDDEAAAAAVHDLLLVASVPLAGAGDVCRRNLRDLVPLAVCDAVPADDLAERAFVVLGWSPVCPCGGTYLVHPVTRETSCSAHGSVRAPAPEPKAPGPLLHDVVRDGTVVRFRWPIDWDRK